MVLEVFILKAVIITNNSIVTILSFKALSLSINSCCSNYSFLLSIQNMSLCNTLSKLQSPTNDLLI